MVALVHPFPTPFPKIVATYYQAFPALAAPYIENNDTLSN